MALMNKRFIFGFSVFTCLLVFVFRWRGLFLLIYFLLVPLIELVQDDENYNRDSKQLSVTQQKIQVI